MLEVTRQRDAFQILGKKLKAHFPCRNLNDAKGGSPLLGDGLVQTDSISVQNRSLTLPVDALPETLYTFCFWLKHDSSPDGGWNRPFLQRPNRQPGFWFYPETNGIHMSTFLDDRNGGLVNGIVDAPGVSEAQVIQNVWTHILLRFRYTSNNMVTSMSQFINGVKVQHSDYQFQPLTPDGPLVISTWFPCNISDIRTYDHYLTDIECGLVYAQSNKLKPVWS